MEYLRLYAHVEYVTGSQLGALYDLQSGRVRTVPLVLGRLLEGFASTSLKDTLKEYFGGDEGIFRRYVDFLVQGKWAFITTRPECFPPASRAWESAYALNSAIIAHDFRKPYDLCQLIAELSAVGCRHLELQLHNYPTGENGSEAWSKIGSALRKGEFRRGTLVHTSDNRAEKIEVAVIDQYLEDWPRFGTVVLLGQKESRNVDSGGRKYHLRQVKTLAEYALNTWQQHPNTHFVGSAYFREARIANPYFNRRLAIDREGNFKNDLLYGGPETFGQVGQHSITAVIVDPKFRRRWLAGPDTITETKDNPLRYCLRYDRALSASAGTAATVWSFASA